MTSHDRHGRYVPVYTVATTTMTPVYLDRDPTLTWAQLRARGETVPAIYITRELQLVHAIAPAWDVPDVILVRFDDSAAVTKEAHRLTVNLWETVKSKFVEFEAKYLAGDGTGTVTSDVYTEMRRRIERVEEAWERCESKILSFTEST